MDLWNGVEKDKVVQAARRAAAARNRTRMEPAQPPLKKVMIAVIMATVHEVIGVCTAATSEEPRRSACCLDELGTGSVSDAWPKWLALQASFIMIIKTHLQIGITGFPTRGCIAATSSCCPYSISMEPEKYHLWALFQFYLDAFKTALFTQRSMDQFRGHASAVQCHIRPVMQSACTPPAFMASLHTQTNVVLDRLQGYLVRRLPNFTPWSMGHKP